MRGKTYVVQTTPKGKGVSVKVIKKQVHNTEGIIMHFVVYRYRLTNLKEKSIFTTAEASGAKSVSKSTESTIYVDSAIGILVYSEQEVVKLENFQGNPVSIYYCVSILMECSSCAVYRERDYRKLFTR